MAPLAARERARELAKTIAKYRDLEHTHDQLPISEEALDSLKIELVRLEEQYPSWSPHIHRHRSWRASLCRN